MRICEFKLNEVEVINVLAGLDNISEKTEWLIQHETDRRKINSYLRMLKCFVETKKDIERQTALSADFMHKVEKSKTVVDSTGNLIKKKK